MDDAMFSRREDEAGEGRGRRGKEGEKSKISSGKRIETKTSEAAGGARLGRHVGTAPHWPVRLTASLSRPRGPISGRVGGGSVRYLSRPGKEDKRMRCEISTGDDEIQERPCASLTAPFARLSALQ